MVLLSVFLNGILLTRHVSGILANVTGEPLDHTACDDPSFQPPCNVSQMSSQSVTGSISVL